MDCVCVTHDKMWMFLFYCLLSVMFDMALFIWEHFFGFVPLFHICAVVLLQEKPCDEEFLLVEKLQKSQIYFDIA